MTNPNNMGIRRGRVGNVAYFPRKNPNSADTYKVSIYLEDNFQSKGTDGKRGYQSQLVEFEVDFFGEQSHQLYRKLRVGSDVSIVDTLKSGNFVDKSGKTQYRPPRLLIEQITVNFWGNGARLEDLGLDRSQPAQTNQVKHQPQATQQSAQQPTAQAQPAEQPAQNMPVQAPAAQQQTPMAQQQQPVQQTQAPVAPQVNMTPEQMTEPAF